MGFFTGTTLTISIIVSVALVVLLIIANWKIFTKAGEGGWKSIIPIYNGYITFKIAWKPSMFWITLLLSVLGGVFCTMSGFWKFIGLGCAMADAILLVMTVYRLAKAFGHGFGYTLGILFLPTIFTLILGLGKDEYLGPQ